MVYEHLDPAQVYTRLLDDWQTLREQGRDVAIVAYERSVVATLNQLARRHLLTTGEVDAKGRTYQDPSTGEKLILATGDRALLEQNYGDLPQPDGHPVAVYNGMRATITAATRHGVQIRLDPDHALPDGRQQIILPAWYARVHLDYAYATTIDKTQGATFDDLLALFSGNTPNERAGVALGRGRYSNRIYALANSDWEHAIAQSRVHTFATHQHPDRLAEHHADILARHRAAEQRRTEQEAWRREHGYTTDRDRSSDARGCGIAM